MNSTKTENREYKSLENIKDGYPKYLLTRNDFIHIEMELNTLIFQSSWKMKCYLSSVVWPYFVVNHVNTVK